MPNTNQESIQSGKPICEIALPSGAIISIRDGNHVPTILESIHKYGWLSQSAIPITQSSNATHTVSLAPVTKANQPPTPLATPAPDAIMSMGKSLTALIEHHHQELVKTIKEQAIEEDHLFSEAMEQYFQSEDFKKLHHSRKGVYAFVKKSFIDIVGDKLLSELRYKDISRYTDILKHIPPNAKNKEEFKGKDYLAIAKQACSKNMKPICPATQYKHVKALKSFCHWCMVQYDMRRDVTSCVRGSDYARDEEQSRQPFDDEELSTIFNHEFLKALDKPWKFWAIIIDFFSGMRVNEIGQINVEDICEVPIGVDEDGHTITVTCISLNTKGGKKLKTRNAKRYLPIHSKVIELGFLDYVRYMKSQNFKHLFPDLYKGAGTPGSKISTWFNSTHLKSWCEIDDSQKKFHSFRNHFWTYAELTPEVPESAIRKLTGTGRGRSTERVHYIKEADVKACKKALEDIAFPSVNFMPYNHEQFKDYFADQIKYATADDLTVTPASTKKRRGRPPKSSPITTVI